MKKFEYLEIINCTIKDSNELGSIGWELVTTVPKYKRFKDKYNDLSIINFDLIYIFKREING